MEEWRDNTFNRQKQEKTETTQPGERIVTNLLERTKNRKLGESGELPWDKHDRTYTEWIRQR